MSDNQNKIAIIGMSCRAPAAKNTNEFWDYIKRGKIGLKRLELQDDLIKGHMGHYVPVYGSIDYYDCFDYSFFNIPYEDAKKMDPQHRLMLEVAYEAIEESGYAQSRSEDIISVYIGARNSTYVTHHLRQNTDYIVHHTDYDDRYYTSPEFIATRVAFYLNLKGPAITISTACSSSLVSVIEASKSLLAYDCNMAIAGGVSLVFPQEQGYWYQEGFIDSKKGECRPFDEAADGTVLTSGVGAVVLKRLDEALEDQDSIYAIIGGYGINNDGGSKSGYAYPSKLGQMEVIQSAIEDSDTLVDDIRYIEAHGTGTYIGDPIEFDALNHIFRQCTDATNYCYLGSLKANFGHSDAAAGILGLIKAALVLHEQMVPPQINYENPNKQLAIKHSAFKFNQTKEAISMAIPSAGVSSFGIGGTNAHVILAAYKAEKSFHKDDSPCHIILSNKTQVGLAEDKEKLKYYIKTPFAELDILEMSYRYQRKECFNYRQVLSGYSKEQLLQQLDGHKHFSYTDTQPFVTFVFSGQNSGTINKSQSIYVNYPALKSIFETCFNAASRQGIHLKPFFDKASLFDKNDLKQSEKTTIISQSVAFTIQYAMAWQLKSLQILPKLCLGHSLGELVSATISNVISLEESYAMIKARAHLFEQYGRGAMILVPMTQEALITFDLSSVSIAGLNGPDRVMLSGSKDCIADIKKVIDAYLKPLGKKTLYFSDDYAFHSKALRFGIDEFLATLNRFHFKAPTLPIFSSFMIETVQEMDASYWVEQIQKPVYFYQSIEKINLKHPSAIFIDFSPDSQLSVILTRNGVSPERVISIFLAGADTTEPYEQTLATLWENRIIHCLPIKKTTSTKALMLPTYSFNRTKCWVEPDLIPIEAPTVVEKKMPFYFYTPSWLLFQENASTLCSINHQLILIDIAHSVHGHIKYHLEENLSPIATVASPGALKETLNNLCGKVALVVVLPKVDRMEPVLRLLTEIFKILPDSEHTSIVISCYFVTTELFDIHNRCHITPNNGLLKSAMNVFACENKSLNTTLIQVPTFEKSNYIKSLKSIIEQPNIGNQQTFIIDSNLIFQQKYQEICVPNQAEKIFNDGIYLIIGGAGGVGMTIAHFLAEKCSCHLLIVGRTIHIDEVALESLESKVAKLTLIHADVSDKSQFIAQLSNILSPNEKIEMVLHCAGSASGQMMGHGQYTWEDNVFLPKIDGTENILKLNKIYQIDKIILFSSIIAHIGGFGQINYATANIIMEKIAEKYSKSEKNVYVIAWDVWRGLGMSSQHLNEKHPQSGFFIDKNDAINAFQKVLYLNMRLVVVSGVRWRNRVNLDYIRMLSERSSDIENETDAPPKCLTYETVAKQLENIWQLAFNIDRVDRTKYICELGGNSLTAMFLIRKINNLYQTSLSLRFLLDHGTINEMANHIHQMLSKINHL